MHKFRSVRYLLWWWCPRLGSSIHSLSIVEFGWVINFGLCFFSSKNCLFYWKKDKIKKKYYVNLHSAHPYPVFSIFAVFVYQQDRVRSRLNWRAFLSVQKLYEDQIGSGAHRTVDKVNLFIKSLFANSQDSKLLKMPNYWISLFSRFPGKTGRVMEIRGWDNESCRSVANVSWVSGSTNVYRLGHKGNVDLRYLQAAPGGFYYRDHMPILGE